MTRVERGRKSARGTITAYADELLARRTDPNVEAKLDAVCSIALRMNWNDLYKRFHFRKKIAPTIAGEPVEKKEPWWNK